MTETLTNADLAADFPTDSVCFGHGTLGQRHCERKPRIRLVVSTMDGSPEGWVTQYCMECFGVYIGTTLAMAQTNVEHIRSLG
jgi:hypothetical protein